MNAANRTVIESNIPAAEDKRDFKNGLTAKQYREQEDITAWLELQEDAEIELLTQEYASKSQRSMRQSEELAYG